MVSFASSGDVVLLPYFESICSSSCLLSRMSFNKGSNVLLFKILCSNSYISEQVFMSLYDTQHLTRQMTAVLRNVSLFPLLSFFVSRRGITFLYQ
ncbi:wsv431 [White spot syndrome virus]|uniref:Wsv431 n=3 Tax=White spot syndrome virus TaxID=342409 RepID=Q8VAI2_WSSVS|nr:wsv431 [Shrimp white spot syndrome virus]AFX59808.1 wsv431 [White spot syndrome virus]AAL33433.1 wsv431 [Shrimp white spot syndrome virus]AAL89358.1 WSSV490 [Shrimp white spot syndrome virus]AWQ60555.1 wsv431 [Shrimp white spot syndrome virus]AWQ60997.1 wsv431 [Shrimp white spot syndrome virus]